MTTTSQILTVTESIPQWATKHQI